MKIKILSALTLLTLTFAATSLATPILLTSSSAPELLGSELLDFNDEAPGRFHERTFDDFVTFSMGEPTSFWGLVLNNEWNPLYGSSGNSIHNEYTSVGFNIDFTTPVESFGFTMGHISRDWNMHLYDENDSLLGTLGIPAPGSPFVSFVGAYDTESTISRVVMRSFEMVIVDEFHYVPAANSGTAPVPEPATMLLFGTGLVGLVGSRLKKKKM